MISIKPLIFVLLFRDVLNNSVRIENDEQTVQKETMKGGSFFPTEVYAQKECWRISNAVWLKADKQHFKFLTEIFVSHANGSVARQMAAKNKSAKYNSKMYDLYILHKWPLYKCQNFKLLSFIIFSYQLLCSWCNSKQQSCQDLEGPRLPHPRCLCTETDRKISTLNLSNQSTGKHHQNMTFDFKLADQTDTKQPMHSERKTKPDLLWTVLDLAACSPPILTCDQKDVCVWHLPNNNQIASVREHDIKNKMS